MSGQDAAIQVVIQETPIRYESVLSDYGQNSTAASRDYSMNATNDQPPPPKTNFIIPKWIYYLFIMIIGTLTLGSPAIIIGLTQDIEAYWPAIITFKFNVTLAETFRWSLLLAGTFASYYFVLTLIAIIPFMVNLFTFFTNRDLFSSREQDGIRRIMIIRHYFAIPVAAFALWALTGLLVGSVSSQSNLVGSSRLSEFYLTRAAFALLLFSLLLFVEKLVIQRVAINYHYDYYVDRISRNQFCLAVLNRLKKKFPPSHRASAVMRADSPQEMAKDEAKDITQAIFDGLCGEGRDYLVPGDFKKALSAEDASKFFLLTDHDGNGDVTLAELSVSIQETFETRDLLTQALASNDALIDRLDYLGIGLVLATTATLCLPVFNVNFATSIFALASTVMTAKIAFSDSIVSIFNTIIFIFVSHPFDVGDVVVVNGSKYKVKSIGWWNSSFFGDGSRLVYIANNTLDASQIGNLRRSSPQVEEFKLDVHFKTTRQQITELEELLSDFLINNPRDFEEAIKIDVLEIVNRKNLRLKMLVGHKSNFQNSASKAIRHNRFATCLRESLKKLEIKLAETD